MNVAIFILGVAGLVLVLMTFWLRGEDLRQYDTPIETEMRGTPPSDQHTEIVLKYFQQDTHEPEGTARELLLSRRQWLENIGLDQPVNSEIVGAIETAPVPGEWVIATGADTSRRLLYLHGGGFSTGSPRSHRPIADKLSQILGGAVFVAQYRLAPENPRTACVEDSQMAYMWLLENGPSGVQKADQVFISGDSAGGNLALGLLPWIRDQGVRQPDAAIALSPVLDANMQGPSIAANAESDIALGFALKVIKKIPLLVRPWLAWIQAKVRPSDPSISPIYADLHDLPPTLIHVSNSEGLLDDSRRWTNKARMAGSPVEIQTWGNTAHGWHIFVGFGLPEAVDAFNEIDAFVKPLLNPDP